MKFNTRKTSKTVNEAGGTAYSVGTHKELYLMVCSSILEETFYEKNTERLRRLIELVSVSDPNFVVGLIIYARTEMHLRSITHVLTVELARLHKGYASRAMRGAVLRVDDMTEILAYQLKHYGKPIPHQIKKGLREVFHKFDEYQLAKYNRGGTVSLRDVLFLTHVRRTDLTNKVVDDTLKIPYTWETELSKSTNKGQTWKELVYSGKLGYMALLRNMRNILTYCGKDVIEQACNIIADERSVHASKQLPFRFLSAYREVQNANSPFVSLVLNALETACGYSAKNLHLSGSSLIACDVSGSMEQLISSKSSVRLIDIGLVLGGVAKYISPYSITGIFGDIFKIKNTSSSSPFNLVNTYKEGEAGYSTNGHLVFDYLTENNISIDNVLIFTDGQWYGDNGQKALSKYKKINPEVKVFFFNLAGYSSVQSLDRNVYNISGWSDHVFEYIEAVNDNDIVKKIYSLSL